MNSLCELICDLAELRGTKAKETLLRLHIDNEELKEFLRLTYDTATLSYYIKNWEPPMSKGMSSALARLTKNEDVVEPQITRSFSIHDFTEMARRLNSRELTGNEARHALTRMAAQGDDSVGALLHWMLARDIRAGVSKKTINKVWPGLITNIPYMRCSLPKHIKLDEIDWSRGVYSQIKYDAMFFNLRHVNGAWHFNTREQMITQHVPAFVELASRIDAHMTQGEGDFVLHGELCVRENGNILPREISNGIVNSLMQGGTMAPNQELFYVTWDITSLESFVNDTDDVTPYSHRLLRLVRVFKGNPGVGVAETEQCFSYDEVVDHFKRALMRKHEGTVFKLPHGIWSSGDSKEQIKMKVDFVVDLVICDFRPGNGKNEQLFGSTICRTIDGKLEVGVSGFTEEMRQYIHEHRGELLNTVMAVRANDLMLPSENNQLHSLFLPRFVELRKDKRTGDTLERVIEERDSAYMNKKHTA